MRKTSYISAAAGGIIFRPRGIMALVVMLMWCVVSASAYGLAAEKTAYPGGKAYYHRLYLAYKQPSRYSLDRPYEFLTPKALKRRERQKLSVDSTDMPVSQHYIDAIAGAGLRVVGTSRWHNTVVVKSKAEDISNIVGRMPFVVGSAMVFHTPDSIERTKKKLYHSSLLPSPFVTQSSPYHAATDNQIATIHGKHLHDKGFRGKGMTIAVVDGGFMNVDKIPAFQQVDIVGMRNFVDDGCTDICTEIDHGTKVLSAMAVNMPNIYIGTAPEARYLLLRSEDYHTESHVEEDYWTMAAEYADSVGVDIINSSLGYYKFDDDTPSTSPQYSQLNGSTSYISQSASMLAQKGIILVNSAGNEGIGTWKKINFPADARDILTVGAINPDGTNAAFSSIGPTSDGRVKPDVMAPGSPARVITGKGTIADEMGTSFASPIVCGMVACLWQAYPDKTAYEIMDMVRRSASRFAHPDNIFGYGIPNFEIKPLPPHP